uniref:Uncharacterized protein n=1 Tax=Triticum urartu TaxID=4572 RepID=A0A8R7V7V4_TRIUA
MLGVGHGVADDVLQEDLEHAAGLLVDEPRDALHAATPRQPPDRRLGDALDVVAQHLPVPLGAALAQPLPSLAAAGHLRRPSLASGCVRAAGLVVAAAAVWCGRRWWRVGDLWLPGFG